MQAFVTAAGVLIAPMPDGSRQQLRVAIGRGGMRRDKAEGDGATPIGAMPLRQVFWRADRLAAPACAVPRLPLQPADAWCDDAAHADYNRLVRLPHEGGHERLWREDPVYDVVGVLGWNDAPVVAGRGSAIFLHVARDGYEPTSGCVALACSDLLWLLSAGMSGIVTEM